MVAEETLLAELFEAFAVGDLEGFLSGCSESLLVTVWGTAPNSTVVSRAGLPAWYEGLRAITEGTLRSDVLLTLSVDIENVVILRHTFVLQGERRRYDTIGHCVVREGKLAAWFSRPSDPEEYANAWRNRAISDPSEGGLRAGTSKGWTGGRPMLSPTSDVIQRRPA